MNTPLMRWLLDIDTIPSGAEGVRIAWENPLPGWLWALIALAGAWLALWSYGRLAGARGPRIALGVARFVLLALVAILLCGPVLEHPRETVEEDWVLVLVDRSRSMSIADAEGRTSRDEQLSSALSGEADMWSRIADNRHLVWLGFHDGAFSLVGDDSGTVETLPLPLPEPAGEQTHLESAIEQALQRAAARPLSGVVILSDGRTSRPPQRALVRRLEADAVRVFPVPLGSPTPIGDVAVRRVQAPRRAFIRDEVPIVVELDHLGATEGGAVVRLVDEGTGAVLDERTLVPGERTEQLTLTAEPELSGEATWRVEVVTAEPDLIPDNNEKPFVIDLIDRPLRVLFVEGYPRWDYRFVKNLLVRESSIESSVMLLSADRDFAQEGNQPITRLPRSSEEFAEFDVIIIGDVPGTFFSSEQLEMIRDQVARRGSGLLWMAGERSTPRTYAGTTLADLLPIRGSLSLGPIGQPVNMMPTPLADRLGVLRMRTDDGIGWPAELTDPTYRWSQLWYAQRLEPGRLKPTAEVLASTMQPVDGVHLPLVTHMRYGAGQTIYVATDEIWRWRYGRGEVLPEQFWIQMIRMLGRESLVGTGDRAMLDASPRRVAVGQPVRIDLRLLDAQLADARRASVRVTIDGSAGRVTDLELRRLEGDEERYAATYLPGASGVMRVTVDDTTLMEVELSTTVEVFTPEDELRRPETDHQLLRELAEATGGTLIQPDEIGSLEQLLPNRSVRTINPLTERIWDTPLFFLLVVLTITLEWVGRKLIRLV